MFYGRCVEYIFDLLIAHPNISFTYEQVMEMFL